MSLWKFRSFKKKFIDLKKVTVIFVVQHFTMMYNKIFNDAKHIAVIIITVIVIIIPVTTGGGYFN